MGCRLQLLALSPACMISSTSITSINGVVFISTIMSDEKKAFYEYHSW